MTNKTGDGHLTWFFQIWSLCPDTMGKRHPLCPHCISYTYTYGFTGCRFLSLYILIYWNRTKLNALDLYKLGSFTPSECLSHQEVPHFLLPCKATSTFSDLIFTWPPMACSTDGILCGIRSWVGKVLLSFVPGTETVPDSMSNTLTTPPQRPLWMLYMFNDSSMNNSF